MFLYKQVPAERLSGLNGFLLMGKPLLGFEPRTALGEPFGWAFAKKAEI